MPTNYLESLIQEAEKAKEKLTKALDMALVNQPEVKVGVTPHEVVFTENKLRLLHYHPVAEKTYPVPLIMIFALINRPYILDLKPGKSVVETLLKKGIDVYLIDWGIPGDEDKNLNLSHYINRYIKKVVEKTKKISGSDKVNIMGYCMGGTMSAMYTALYPEDVKNLVLMTAGIDFKVEGTLNLWSEKPNFDVNKFVEAYGNVPPEFLQASFLFMKPVQNLVSKYVSFYENVDNEQFVENFFAMEKWINDNIPVPGEVFREFVKYCYQENLLVENKLRINGKPVDLRKIRCPVLNLIAEKYKISREEQDEFAFKSQVKTKEAMESDRFQSEIVPIEIQQRKGTVVFKKDEHPRDDTTLESLSKLRPVFKNGGTVTAGNASGINDGAAAMIVTTEEKAKELGLKVWGTIKSYAVSGVDPSIMGMGPVTAMQKALEKAGLTIDDIDLTELNEAFAAQSLGVLREFPIPSDKLNINGGAITLGHPIGASGAILTVKILHELERRNASLGLVSLCVGGGMGIAMVVEREKEQRVKT